MVSNGTFDPISSYARLAERVDNQGKDIVDLRSNMNTGFNNVQAALSSLTNEFRGSTKTQWPVIWSAIGVCFAVLGGLGAAIYLPQREDITEVKSSVRENAGQALSVAAFQDFKATYENNRIVSRTENIDKFNQISERIKIIESTMVPRQELERVWASYDSRLGDHQRQLDELKTQAASIYSARDVLLDLRSRLREIETTIARTPGQ